MAKRLNFDDDWFPTLPEGVSIQVSLRTTSASADENQIRKALQDVELDTPLETSHAMAVSGSNVELSILIDTALFFRDRWANQAMDKLKDLVKKAYTAMKDTSDRGVSVEVADQKVSLYFEEDVPDEAMQALVDGQFTDSLPHTVGMIWDERQNAWVPGRPKRHEPFSFLDPH
jgi:RNA polymerase-interacting CarD/CdnL/TRCF family regulator